ncbi:uncharacterized protein LOC106179706 [Lingula anatina]|uniref:Uncharacterized protein LOC106179706 n=1 Tax=Lingula anatina TaxID=7574 RepID=A0A1S3K9E7_LINAN|nr:uncharacterized protein LOC106179706 [Lingula anatina]|eukprot:XP_013418886.1 uncharacterized protein LOC106179706 [Lingula anatina]
MLLEMHDMYDYADKEKGSILHMEPPIHRTMYATDAQAPAYYKTPVAVTTTTPVRQQQHHQQPQHCGHLSYSKQPPQLVRKTVNGTIINVLTSPERSDQMIITPLTPPPTPDSNQL